MKGYFYYEFVKVSFIIFVDNNNLLQPLQRLLDKIKKVATLPLTKFIIVQRLLPSNLHSMLLLHE